MDTDSRDQRMKGWWEAAHGNGGERSLGGAVRPLTQHGGCQRVDGHGTREQNVLRVSILLTGLALETWLGSHQGVGECFVVDKRTCFKMGSIFLA